ncbi:MAG: DUF4263 domain-containing protein [Magnetococcus sp. YQC-5]
MSTKEEDIHKFFERNPDFILNDDYKKAHSKLTLSRDGSELIPDFVLEPVDQEKFCDLLEIKSTFQKVFVIKKNRVRFSSAVYEACAQLRTYSLFFDDERNRYKVFNKHGVNIYKPRMFLIIGRKGKTNQIDAINASLDLPYVTIRSYDDVLSMAANKLNKIGYRIKSRD